MSQADEYKLSPLMQNLYDLQFGPKSGTLHHQQHHAAQEEGSYGADSRARGRVLARQKVV